MSRESTKGELVRLAYGSVRLAASALRNANSGNFLSPEAVARLAAAIFNEAAHADSPHSTALAEIGNEALHNGMSARLKHYTQNHPEISEIDIANLAITYG